MNSFSEKWLNSDVKPKRRKYYGDSKRADEFKERFAIDQKWHGFKMTSHGCFQRHTRTRDDQNMTRHETEKKNFEGSNFEEYKERTMMSDFVRYLNMGYVMGNEHPDEFVARIKEELAEEE